MLILVAEDNNMNQALIQAMLSAAGHEAVIVSNGAEAVEAVQAQNFDVVLMDVQMPVMDGPTAVGEIRKLGGAFESLPVIALTANALVGDREKYLAQGMNDYVEKPIMIPDLMAALSRCASGADSTGGDVDLSSGEPGGELSSGDLDALGDVAVNLSKDL